MLTKLDSALAQEWLYVQGIQAYGTPEGAKKGWDTRGRGRKNKSSAGELTLMGPHKLKAEASKLKAQYESLGKRIDSLAKKMDEPDNISNIGLKFLHLAKRLGDWIEPLRNLRELLFAATVAVWGVLHEGHRHIAKVHAVISWAYSHIAPILGHITQVAQAGGLPR